MGDRPANQIGRAGSDRLGPNFAGRRPFGQCMRIHFAGGAHGDGAEMTCGHIGPCASRIPGIRIQIEAINRSEGIGVAIGEAQTEHHQAVAGRDVMHRAIHMARGRFAVGVIGDICFHYSARRAAQSPDRIIDHQLERDHPIVGRIVVAAGAGNQDFIVDMVECETGISIHRSAAGAGRVRDFDPFTDRFAGQPGRRIRDQLGRRRRHHYRRSGVSQRRDAPDRLVVESCLQRAPVVG